MTTTEPLPPIELLARARHLAALLITHHRGDVRATRADDLGGLADLYIDRVMGAPRSAWSPAEDHEADAIALVAFGIIDEQARAADGTSRWAATYPIVASILAEYDAAEADHEDEAARVWEDHREAVGRACAAASTAFRLALDVLHTGSVLFDLALDLDVDMSSVWITAAGEEVSTT
jgi:hypothetical protein